MNTSNKSFEPIKPGFPNPERTFLHIDGDAFFASVYQATHPEARGKPVAIGAERGLVTALSYEAKAFGVKRGMLGTEVKKLCPQCIFATSDYRIYTLFSNRMVHIACRYSPYVECYSIDEVFVDITGLDVIHKMSYADLGQTVKEEIENSLGITVSGGVANTKTLCKIASGCNKPSGFCYLPPNSKEREPYLTATPVEDIWGIGHRTAPRLQGLGIHTATDLAALPREYVAHYFNKPLVQTWYELNGHPMFDLSLGHKDEYQSIQRTRTVTPATTDPDILVSRLIHHVETAWAKARKLHYRVGGLHLMLKNQEFRYFTTELKLAEPLEYPYILRPLLRKAFAKIYRPGMKYRATGCTLTHLSKSDTIQETLFAKETQALEKKLKSIYPLYEKNLIMFGSDLYDIPGKPNQLLRLPSI